MHHGVAMTVFSKSKSFRSTVMLNMMATDVRSVQLGIKGLWSWHTLGLNIWVGVSGTVCAIVAYVLATRGLFLFRRQTGSGSPENNGLKAMTALQPRHKHTPALCSYLFGMILIPSWNSSKVFTHILHTIHNDTSIIYHCLARCRWIKLQAHW